MCTYTPQGVQIFKKNISQNKLMHKYTLHSNYSTSWQIIKSSLQGETRVEIEIYSEMYL